MLDRLSARIVVCTQCPLHESRENAVPGEGPPDAALMIVGEAPGRSEDRQGRPFVGRAGEFLNELLALAGVAREEVFITNIVKCRPPENRTPDAGEVGTCVGLYLLNQIQAVDPELVLALGREAARTLAGVSRLSDAHGRIIERDGRRYFVSYHPAARMSREVIRDDFRKLAKCLSFIEHRLSR